MIQQGQSAGKHVLTSSKTWQEQVSSTRLSIIWVCKNKTNKRKKIRRENAHLFKQGFYKHTLC